MKKPFTEKLVVEEISRAGESLCPLLRGLRIGQLLKMIRVQLGMSQKALSKRAKIPQATLSRLEQAKGEPNMATLAKVFNVMSCDLVIIPVLRETIDNQRRRQARRIAEKEIRYLKGTMNLEDQEPDSEFMNELLKQRENELLHSKTKLWEMV